jgi:hypothetical protein
VASARRVPGYADIVGIDTSPLVLEYTTIERFTPCGCRWWLHFRDRPQDTGEQVSGAGDAGHPEWAAMSPDRSPGSRRT